MATELVRTPLRVVGPLAEPVRASLQREVRKSLGEPGSTLRAVPRGRPFVPRDAVTRRVHGDLPSMLIGGLSALLLQTLHPLVMAGVAEHSRYREDAIGRLRRTASFVEVTTFGTELEAERAIQQVRLVHARVKGRAPDGRPYDAADPELVTWVHVTETSSFLAASQRYGPDFFDPPARDRYYDEMARIATRLGARWVPRSEAEVDAYFRRISPHLYAGTQALEARDFLLRGVAHRVEDRALYTLIVSAAIGLLPRWARDELRIPTVPLVDRCVVTPLSWAFCQGLRWAISPEIQPAQASPPAKSHRATGESKRRRSSLQTTHPNAAAPSNSTA